MLVILRRFLLSVAFLLPLQLWAALPLADSQGKPLPTLAPMLERTIPAVVNIMARARVQVQQNPLLADPFFRRFFNLPSQPSERRSQSLGSGVIIDAKNGYLLTNHHVIDNADQIQVNLADGRTLQATVVGSDPETDIAVLQVENGRLTALPLADSDQLRVGDFVIAIGNPFGLGQTVTSGIVSALSRSGLGIEGYEDFIQTDASINPGNSGGALVNLRGELVGINTAILSKGGGNVGIGFAIPINMAREVMQQLVEHGAVLRGSLGASAQDLTPELAAAFGFAENLRGAVVTQVTAGSPAERAGLRSGDVIIAIDGRAVRNADDVRNRIGLLRVGQKVALQVMRNGKSRTLHAVIERETMVSVAGEVLHPRLAGAHLTQQASGRGESRIAITAVDGGSYAQRAGLRAGDLLLQANRQVVQTLDELAEAVANKRSLLLNIQRGEGAIFIYLQ
jgi:Do/DeqQ family serine protease